MITAILIFLISITLGSFANNIISFYSGDSKFDISRSVCLCGGKLLSKPELIPLFSFLYLRGKCKSCKLKISIRYPLVELIYGITGLTVLFKYGFTVNAIFVMLTFSLLIIAAVVDLKVFKIPNLVVLFLLILALLRYLILDSSILSNFIIALSAASFFILTNFFSAKYFKKDAVGYGDIKLIFALILLNTPLVSLFTLWLSALIAVLSFTLSGSLKPGLRLTIFPRRNKVPFGFYLSFCFIVVFLNNHLVNIFLNYLASHSLWM